MVASLYITRFSSSAVPYAVYVRFSHESFPCSMFIFLVVIEHIKGFHLIRRLPNATPLYANPKTKNIDSRDSGSVALFVHELCFLSLRSF